MGQRTKSFKEVSIQGVESNLNVKLIIYYKNKQLLYHILEQNDYCVIPFAFISQVASEGNDPPVLKIELNTQPFYFKTDKELADYSKLNKATSVIRHPFFNDQSNRQHRLLLPKKKLRQCVGLLQHSTVSSQFRPSDQEFKVVNFSAYFFSEMNTNINPEISPPKPTKSEPQSSSKLKRNRDEMESDDLELPTAKRAAWPGIRCYLDNAGKDKVNLRQLKVLILGIAIPSLI